MNSQICRDFTFICVFVRMSTANCYVCGQNCPCSRTPLDELPENEHEKVVRPLKKVIKQQWGLGTVRVTCCGAIYANDFNQETGVYDSVFQGDSEEKALQRIPRLRHFSKVFVYFKCAFGAIKQGEAHVPRVNVRKIKYTRNVTSCLVFVISHSFPVTSPLRAWP